MTNMLRFLIFLFLGVCAYLTSNEKPNYSRHPTELSHDQKAILFIITYYCSTCNRLLLKAATNGMTGGVKSETVNTILLND